MFKQKYKVLFLLFVLLPLFPSPAWGAKQVSQNFQNPWGIAYFPLTEGAVLIDGSTIYSSKRPGVAEVWTAIGETFTHPSGYDHFFKTPIGVEFGGAVYVILETEAGEDDWSYDPITTEVWRMSKYDPTSFRSVLELSALTWENDTGTYVTIQELFTFKNALYALKDNGELWKTKNGTNWFQVETVGLPDYGNRAIYTVATSDDRLYLGIGGFGAKPTIYATKRGTTWHQLKGKYDNEMGQVIAMTVWQNRLFAAISNVTGTAHYLWKQTDDGSWQKLLTTDQFFTDVAAARDVLLLVQYNPDKNRTRVKSSADGKIFNSETTLESSYLANNRIIQLKQKVLLLVTQYEEAYLLRL